MRLIDADALYELIDNGFDIDFDEVPETKAALLEMIEGQETVEERKKGKWIVVHGYCTPGGDPVWACSECGKGEHVYGIEYPTYSHNVSDGQWVSCPNCGAEMER